MKKLLVIALLCASTHNLTAYFPCDQCDYRDWCNIFYLHRRGGYIAASGSYDWYNSILLDSTLNNSIQHKSVRPDNGYNINASIGYIVNHWRLEAEVSYRDATEDAQFTHTAGGDSITVKEYSHVGKYSLMANAIFDLPICKQKFMLYAGAGVGVAFSDSCIYGTLGGNPVSYDKNFAHFAYQLLAGMSYNICKCVDLTLGYRFFGMSSRRTLNDTNLCIEFHNQPLAQSVEAGLRFYFR